MAVTSFMDAPWLVLPTIPAIPSNLKQRVAARKRAAA
jgi:hypothetical protein